MKLNKKLLLVLVIASILPPLLFRIIEYRAGKFDSWYVFFESLLFNTIISLIVTLSISWVILSLLHWLNNKVPWNENILKRLFLEVVTTFPAALSMGYIFGNIAFYINPYNNTAYRDFIFSFLVISAVMNFILVAISDWFHFFNRWKESLVENEKAMTKNAVLEKENIASQYEVLKNQINPHFLFNSLNVLSSLVQTDPGKAEDFIDEFAELYRYILDQNEKDLVTLNEELEISKSYVFLQKIRFEDGIVCNFDIENKDIEGYQIFPLALQTLLENAVKHNTTSDQSPLIINVSLDNEQLVVSNNLQLRENTKASTGIGIPNLIKRYKHYGLTPTFEKTRTHYNCYLPLLR